ncbi:hypothetical protein [Egicoccus sp. AB-alg6-2]|uniref:hypothetical protein n=1 Tax=Egicoccus sp. AB-alg6-2 TaxID=3242692 RepID=UPI00359E7373
MTTPLFAHAAVPLSLSPSESLTRLLADPTVVTVATADAIGRCAPRFADWGLPMHVLPTVETTVGADDEPGQVRLRWSGPEDVTGWPSMTAWLAVSPRGRDGSRITLVSPRTPQTGLGITSVHRTHARRLLAVAVRSFLQELATQLSAASAAAVVPERSGALR